MSNVRSLSEMSSYKAQSELIAAKIKDAGDNGNAILLSHWRARKIALNKWHKARRCIHSPELPGLSEIQSKLDTVIIIDELRILAKQD